MVISDFPYTTGRNHPPMTFSQMTMLPHDVLPVSSMSHSSIVICGSEYISVCKTSYYCSHIVGVYANVFKHLRLTTAELSLLATNPLLISWHLITVATYTK